MNKRARVQVVHQSRFRERAARAAWPLLCALGLASSAHAQVSAAETFAISGPTALVLGRDTQTTLQISAPDDAQFRVYANIGQLGAPSHVGAGQWQVGYTLPTQRYPQLAVIGVVEAHGTQFAATSIALHGSAHVEIRSEPEIAVEVRVGDALFGPTRTDRAGHATLPVVVPPGFESAISVATDALGNNKEQTIPLGVPPVQPVLSVCVPQRALTVLAFVFDNHGTARTGARLEAHGQDVQLEHVQELAAGVYQLTFMPLDSARSGAAVALTTTLSGQASALHACESVLPVVRRDAISQTARDASRGPATDTPFEVGVQAGWLTNFAKVRGPAFAVRAGYRLGFGLSFGLQLGYAASWHAAKSADHAETIDTDLSTFSTLARAAYTFELQPVQLWLFGAGGVAIVGSTVSGRLVGEARETNAAPAFAAGGGASIALGPGRIGLELSYTLAQLTADSVRGNAAGFGAGLNYVLRL